MKATELLTAPSRIHLPMQNTNLPPSQPANQPVKVLMIDDDRELCTLITDYLTPLGYSVVAAHDGVGGVEAALSDEYQAILLDVMLPGIDGFEVLKRIRSKSDAPILMLTARGDETDRIVGLEMGADDYLPKTFSPRELLARLRAVTRRSARTAPSAEPAAHPGENGVEVTVGPLRIRADTRSATLDGKPLRLTTLEFDLLLVLAKARGRVKTREQLIQAVADRSYDGLDRSIDVHVWSLRRKMGDDSKEPRFIKTIRAVGYMLLNPADA